MSVSTSAGGSGGRAYAGILLLTFAIYVLMYAPQPFLATMAAEFGASKASAGLTVSVGMFVMCVSPLFVGVLLQKIGPRKALLATSALFALTSIPFLFCGSYGSVLALRTFQALLVPFALTAIMTSITALFSRQALTKAMGAYVAITLLGTIGARIGCGILAELFGWRAALASLGIFFALSFLILAVFLADAGTRKRERLHSLKEYLSVLKIPCVGSLLYAEACGLFIFGGIGNLVPFRMTELAAGAGEGRIGMMYVGYVVGIVVSFSVGWFQKKFGTPMRQLVTGALLYMLFFAIAIVPSEAALFACIWLIPFGQFLIHGLCPGLVNITTAGRCDSAMVNGLYLSAYYLGGTLGSIVPVMLYDAFGWTAAFVCMELVLLSSFLVLLRLLAKEPQFCILPA